MASRRAQLVKDYPNLLNQNLMLMIGCVDEFTEEEANQFFTRTCFRNVRIVRIEPLTNNHQPYCTWRVYYQLIATPNRESADDKSVPEPLPDDEPLLKKLFMDITAQSEYVGMNVVQKQKYDNDGKSYAIVEYSPKSCSCTAQDFKLAAKEPRMQPTISEVEMDLYGMKL